MSETPQPEASGQALVERLQSAQALILGLAIAAFDRKADRKLTAFEYDQVVRVLGDAADALSTASPASSDVYWRWYACALERVLAKMRDVLTTVSQRAPGYDWNADPQYLTRLISNVFAAADALASRPTEATHKERTQ
jgi:hypothetical protein